MAESTKKTSSGAVDQIIDNMTSDIQNADGQFIQLGFTPPATPAEPWNLQNKLPYVSQYHLNGMHNQEPHLFSPVDQFNQQLPYDYVPQPGLYNTEMYENRNSNDMKQHYFDMYHQNKSEAAYMNKYHLFTQDNIRPMNPPGHSFMGSHHDDAILSNNANSLNSQCPAPNRNCLIENLVGNWAPNINGTYTPFGSVPVYTHNCLNNAEVNHTMDFPERTNEEVHFQFNRDNKKPRIVAEVKPMRPSYSDVLLKSVPQNVVKSSKNEVKESKIKKEAKKNTKSEKLQKLNNSLNRNIINDAKETSADKSTHSSKNQDSKLNKDIKPNQLNRKWSSLDNVTDTFSENKADIADTSKPKKFEDNVNKNNSKTSTKKPTKSSNDFVENSNTKPESSTAVKTTSKKNKILGRPRSNDSFGTNDRPPGKRSQRNRKRENNSRLSNEFNEHFRLCIQFSNYCRFLPPKAKSLPKQLVQNHNICLLMARPLDFRHMQLEHAFIKRFVSLIYC